MNDALDGLILEVRLIALFLFLVSEEGGAKPFLSPIGAFKDVEEDALLVTSGID